MPHVDDEQCHNIRELRIERDVGPCYLCGHPSLKPFGWSPIHWYCSRCGLVALSEEHREDSMQLYDAAFFDGRRFAETGGVSGYPSSYADPQKSHRLGNFACYTERLCRNSRTEGWRVLDFGCGYGLFLRHLKEHVPLAEVVGVEVNAAVANKAAQLAGCKITTVLPEAQFDRIVLLDVLEHLSDPRATLQCLFDLAKPGAQLLLTTPNIGSWNAQIFQHQWNLINPPEHLMYFRPNSLARLIAQTGWQAVDIRTQGHLLHNERGVSESWRGRLARRIFGGKLQDALFNQALRVGPVLAALTERPLP